MRTRRAGSALPGVDALRLPQGFRFAATACGLKKNGRLDLALLSSDAPAAAAAVFTTNRVKAAPVLLSRAHLRSSAREMRAIVANSGNANCATGKAGLAVARATAEAVARELRCRPQQVLVCSTGVIGVDLPLRRLLDALPPLAAAERASRAAFAQVARAIMTTDTHPKWAAADCRVSGRPVRLVGCAKGAGMIHPQMATMLAFLLTDATIPPPVLQRALAQAVRGSFNAISVDGDTSTNDTVLLLANAASGAPPIRYGTPEYRRFLAALDQLCRTLALAIVADGEGAGRIAEIEVRGAPSDHLAEAVARTIAGSALVKTALAGADANWGRILAAAGRAPWPDRVTFDGGRVEIRLAGFKVCHQGRAHPFDERAAHRRLLGSYVPILVDLHGGPGRARAWTCDLTAKYVRINASYRT
jgi:glutamate N-acetyltransferase / amino-acid N-acetyltransferase